MVVLDPVDDEALAELRARYHVTVRLQPPEDELRALVADAEVVVLRSGVKLTAETIESARSLRVIARAGVGVDNIDLDAARRRGVLVFNLPGRSAPAVAEFAMGLTLAVARRIALAHVQVRADRWRKPDLVGHQLRGRTMGIAGLGAIGAELAGLATAFGMRVIGSVARPSALRRAEFAKMDVDLVDNATVFAESDIVVLAVPLRDDTRGLVAERELASMKRSAYLVNVSRGGVVDEDDLCRALRDGVIAGAALDVLATERQAGAFAELDNVVLTPHIGAMTVDAQREIGRALVESIDAALSGARVATRVC